jgi:Spx/MgsR family transcriptional regulator
MTLQVHGIASCDSCRKARRWLEAQGIAFDWIDLRDNGIDAGRVERWLQRVDPERLVNRRSTTWRQLPGDQRPALNDPDLPAVLVRYPTLIKRPVFELGDETVVGFDDAAREWLTRR